MKHEGTEAPRVGEVLVVQPGEAPSYWQPVPANGFIEVLVAPDRVAMEHPIGLGTQVVPPGCTTSTSPTPGASVSSCFMLGSIGIGGL